MIRPSVIKGINPLYIQGSKLIYSKGNLLLESDPLLSSRRRLGYYNAGYIRNCLASFDFPNRIGRLGFHTVVPFKKNYVAVQKGNIVLKREGREEFEIVFSEFRGSRPLNLYVSPQEDFICFGEYFGNRERDKVRIFSSSNGIDWKVSYVFPANSIRHVHGIFDDPFRKGIWVLTGDSNSESGLWFTSNRFETLEKVVSGTQKARAVEIIPVEGGLLVPMDSPLEKNFIHFFDLEKKEFIPLCALEGSAFHANKSNDLYFVTTVTEPSTVNETSTAMVYASLDGLSWKCISIFEKDFIPIKYQGITRYSEIIITNGQNNTDFIFGYVRAVKNYSNSLVKWKRDEVVDFLMN